ncbi:MAG: FAD-dependent oxidoreductase [Oscillospiraceae bacterium]|nr:FAD-dependent oxidoreductase [Oscillospiraceae bacterium]
MSKKEFPNLLSPLKVNGRILKNRIMSAPNMLFHTVDGRPTDYYTAYLEHKARGGAAIVNLGEVSVGDGANHTPEMIKNNDNLPLFAELAAAIHEHGAIASAELTHGGNRGKPQFNRERMPKGPMPFTSMIDGKTYPALTKEELEFIVQQHADTAEYMFSAGFDAVHLHFGHGWLPAQFLSPLINQRTDEFGGSFENRMRFPLMICKAVRERVGKDKLITMRLSGSERAEGGFTPEDMAEFLSYAQEYIDLVEISCEVFTYCMASTYRPLNVNTEFSEVIKKSGKVNIPVYVVGSIIHPEDAEEIIASGKADGVSMSRALIADPYMPEKIFLGKADDVTPCVRCLNCTDSDNAVRHFECSVNPLIGREARLGFGEDIGKAKVLKKVLVVGGGIAGMEAAITAAERGHEVILCEKSDKLGGLLNFTDTDSLKHDLRRYKNFMVEKTLRSKIKIMLNTEVTPELAEALAPTDIIVATGSAPKAPTYIKGYEKAYHAMDMYNDPKLLEGKKNVVMIGGGLVGVEAGLHLRNSGYEVTVLELDEKAHRDARGVYLFGLLQTIDEQKLNIVTGARCTEITDSGVVYEKDGKTEIANADIVLYAVGMKSCDELYFDLAKQEAKIAIIGDSKKPGKVTGAVHDGFFAALDVGRI